MIFFLYFKWQVCSTASIFCKAGTFCSNFPPSTLFGFSLLKTPGFFTNIFTLSHYLHGWYNCRSVKTSSQFRCRLMWLVREMSNLLKNFACSCFQCMHSSSFSCVLNNRPLQWSELGVLCCDSNCELPHNHTQIVVIHSMELHSFRFSAILMYMFNK